MNGKKILLGVTGSIAAFKAAELTSALVQKGCRVRVVMTRAAGYFISPLTLQTLSGHRVYRKMFAVRTAGDEELEHVALAGWPDVVLVCPATADIIARVAAARADDLLAAIILATNRPVVMVPAMNQGMWENPRLQRKVAELAADGVRFVGPGKGRLACGREGTGRMAEVPAILEYLAQEGGLFA